MKNMKAIAFLLLALVTGIAAAVYAAGWLSQRGSIASNKVAVAAVDIELGSKINPQMLTLVDWPSASIPPGAFRDLKELQDRVARVNVLRGDAVLERKLAPAGTQGGLSAVIAEGKRAMTVRVNDVVGVAGFALPGNYVDVLVNAHQDHGKGEASKPITITVLEHVLVLAVAQEASRDETKPKVVNAVTLELTPQDAQKLDLARSIGSLSLALRNQLDKETVAAAGFTKGQLLGEPEVMLTKTAAPARAMGAPGARKVEPPPKPAECVDVIHLGARSLMCF
jgi:pilus assembly protein CpaB